MNEMVGMNNRLMMYGGKNWFVCIFKRQEFWKFIGCILSAVTYGNKVHKIWIEIPDVLVRIHQINYKDMFVVTQTYIRYVVIYILLITVMLAIELFYLTQFHSFLWMFL